MQTSIKLLLFSSYMCLRVKFVCLLFIAGTRDAVHRLHWLGTSVIYLINVSLNKEIKDLAPAFDQIMKYV